MAMVIENNLAAQMTLGEMNKNNNKLGKQLKKVSSGMRINGAGDDASGYSISERMRVRIRALDQDERNVQNGASLLRVAEGGIQSQIEIMKTIKQKVIDADNDTNTDIDRATIQKEIDQGYRQIEDIAWET
ncbi:MAG: flagellin, partial [Schwartzia sp.]|nr:flagellin [Schwartzia sp. (in: firmicutes)]